LGLALYSALGIAGTGLLIRIGTDTGRATDAVVVVLLVNVSVTVPVAFVFGSGAVLTPLAVASFIAAGLVGTMLGRVFYFTAIQRVGASRAEPIKASMPLHSSIVAILVLGESLTGAHFVGVLLIVLGVAVLSLEGHQTDTMEVNNVDLLLPLAAAFLFGVEPVLAKIGFGEGTPVVVALAIKTCAATIGFLLYITWQRVLPSATRLREGNLRWFVAAGVVNTSFLFAYYGALLVSPVVLVVPIMQMSPLIVVLLSYLFLRRLEHVTWRIVAGASIVVVGATVITVFT
jgi:DME family drug/metabolite transporter